MKSPLRLLGFLFVLLTLTGGAVWAATQNALVTGSVFDQNGAAVPGATVRLLNASIGFSQTLPTDANGNYTFGSVPPAENYVMSVEISGFATVIRPGLSVAVGEAKLVLPPFILQPAAQPGQEIREEAPAAAPVALEMVSTTLGGVVDSRALRTLPLVGRDFIDLALLIPGTYPVEQGSALAGASLVTNGVRGDMNNFLLDGADNNDYTLNQSLPFQLVEAMQEFRVQTSTSNAEFGRNAGSQVNLLSRSGTNDIHGTFFWFNRNSALSAEDALSAYRGGTFDAFAQSARVDQIRFGAGTIFPTPVLSDPVLSALFDETGRDPDVNQNQFGANFGAPIVKDKLFFFFNWESTRADNDRPVFERVPSLDLRGAFFGVDPSTRRVNALLNLFPLPNVPTSTVLNAFGFPVSDPLFGDSFGRGAFAIGDAQNSTHSDNFLERIDWRVSDRVSLSFKHNIQRIRQLQGGRLFSDSNTGYPGSGSRVSGRNQNFSFNYLHTLSDRTTNEFRFGWNRFRLTTLPVDATLDPSTLFDNLNFVDKGFPNMLMGGYQFSFGPYAPLGADFNSPNDRANNVWSFADNIGRTWGRHVLKAGIELRHNRLNTLNEALGRGLVTFFTVPFAVVTGLPDLASIGRVSPEFGGGFDRSFSSNSFNWFIQDTWRPRSYLSFTAGLRHEVNSAPREGRDRLVNNYPGTCGQLICLMRSGTDTILDTDGTVLGTAGFTAPRAGFDTDWNNFGPHLGLAWDPWKNGKTVFRGGYAVAFDQQSLQASANMLLNPPFVQQWSSFFPFVSLGDVFPPGFPAVPFAAFDLDGDASSSIWLRQPYSITARSPDTRTSYVHQWNLGVQQQVGSSSLFEAAYVGSAGHKLPRLRFWAECTGPTFLGSPFACLPAGFFGGSGAASDSVINQENTANSNFHSLQIRWETRAWHSLTVRMHYQWAHSIDDASSSNPPVFFFSPASASLLSIFFGINADQFASLNSSNPALSLRPGLPIITTRGMLPADSLNSANLAGERASSDFDVRHRFVVHYIYDVPKWGPTLIGAGWQLAGVTTFQSGSPYTVFGDFFGVPLRPDQLGAVTTDNDNAGGAIDGGLPSGCNVFFVCAGTGAASAFDPTLNAFFLPGALARNTFKGPALVNFDFSFLKNTYVGKSERVNLQFRVEFFNLFNNVNFRQPFSQSGQFVSSGFGAFTIPNPFFGQILQVRPGREIQWGLKIIF